MPDDQPPGAGAGCPDSTVADRQAAPPPLHGTYRSLDCKDGDDSVQQMCDGVPWCLGAWKEMANLYTEKSFCGFETIEVILKGDHISCVPAQWSIFQ